MIVFRAGTCIKVKPKGSDPSDKAYQRNCYPVVQYRVPLTNILSDLSHACQSIKGLSVVKKRTAQLVNREEKQLHRELNEKSSCTQSAKYVPRNRVC